MPDERGDESSVNAAANMHNQEVKFCDDTLKGGSRSGVSRRIHLWRAKISSWAWNM
ncbi:hypothetical protein BDV24DRAFT_141497 [Aspergillus arachidicola]|uniref:Uncharacterized protein n=1 Tax=Aspergillus arachidicola TaxID=656916 RepID=A0A5N6XU24_9EURO|nr:hypothetical protein BDV24DRAFT_141497 [Aspergillus arachidicola]